MSETPQIGYRLATPEEDSFFRRLFDITRAPEFQMSGIVGDPLAQLLESQYHARQTHYAAMYPTAEYRLILADGELTGGMIVREMDEHLHLIDITLLDECRGRGIGTLVMRELQATAESAGKGVLLHVEHFNPARRLYDRLGFVEVEEIGLYKRMVWKP
ncbi:MAG: GNAT family N-acetyltransferase [Fimbriimonadaceae bacterium]|nr:GNAT family N-acetyltransferase [Fimbriimonadaceae bacterium]